MNDRHIALALDVGERRIGVAVASMIARLPAPCTTLDRTQVKDVFAAIEQLIAREGAGLIVVGLPHDMQGRETEQTRYTRQFARELQDRIGQPVILQDETATSINAEERLKSRGKPYGKADIDSEAAVIILQDFLAQEGRRVA